MKYTHREPKRTDVRDTQRMLDRDLAAIRRRQEERQDDALLADAAAQDDLMHNALGDLLAGLPGITVLTLDGEPWPEPPKEAI